MLNYLKIIRFPNLLFIVLVQFLMQQSVVTPILQVYGFESISLGLNFVLLVAATVFTAAGGYVLNDYFDVKIDAINRPEKQIVGKAISKERAMRYYQIVTGIGLVCGLCLSYLAGSFTLAFIFIVTPGLLWFYSSNYKRQFLIGNIVTAFNTALSVLIVAIVVMAFMYKSYGNLIFETNIPRTIYGWVGGFAVFAFVLTWIREVIKDMEDEKGDREMECRTMPIKWGMGKTKIFVCVLILLTVIALFVVNKLYIPFEGTLTIRYIVIGLIVPMLVLIYLVFRAKTPSDFHQSSTLSKFIMLIGVLYCLVFYYLQAKTYGITMFGLFLVGQ
ncbi:prenyltransferase [Paludibacter sp. 221]|uniref:geranylgeranylglycerol-phosphate geranylgeranyltransferase n=1 Tax=Paludibacter sp. 221 TaxID=2302939 RepID=UPI0013D4D5E6|nr:geranylgeranylglycerol-phosphate geranylgeranyltransferase [Paludibacter sp. 221]NDV46965.1 prenyltransferase [Paludibacter sp. 221]